MTARASGVVLLALVSSMPLACGKNKGASPDGGTDGPRCRDAPVSCVEGGPSGDGVFCADLAVAATCIGIQWTCPKGMVETRTCTCEGPPRAGCTTCTAHGWVCADAGVDADATSDAPVDGDSCSDASFRYCFQGGRVGDVTICDDFGAPATCVDGQWTCPAGSVDGGCDCGLPHAPGCGVCTKTGWQCDGGADATSDAPSAS